MRPLDPAFFRYTKPGPNGCLLFVGGRERPAGRSGLNMRRYWKNTPAYRYAWEMARGEIKPGMTIDHLCGEVDCVRVEHMQLVTRSENIKRYWRRKKVG